MIAVVVWPVVAAGFLLGWLVVAAVAAVVVAWMGKGA